MKHVLSLSLALFAFCAPVLAQDAKARFPPAKPEDVGLDTARLEDLATFVKGLTDKDDVVGAELLLIRSNRTVLHRAFGWKDREDKVAMEPNTIFCVRSMTKPVAGTAAAMLIDAKKLALSDKVAKHLPSFDNERSRDITVEMLLHHRGGLYLSTLLQMDVTQLTSVRAVADAAGERGPEHPPGTVFSYSDDGADTVGAIVEAISGDTLDVFAARRIFEPLRMDDAIPIVALDHPKRARIASDYSGTPRAWVKYWHPKSPPIFPVFLASQALYCTPMDYAKFLALWKDKGYANGEQLLTLKSVRRALAPGVETGYPTGFAGLGVDYGEMWMLYVDRTDAKKPRVVAFGHGGSDGTFSYCFPELDLIALYFTQARGTLSGMAFEEELQRLVIDPLTQAKRAPPVAYGADELAAIAGEYWCAERERLCAIEVHGGALRIQFPGLANAELKPTQAKDRFALPLAPTDSFEVLRDEHGAVRGLVARSKMPSGEPVALEFERVTAKSDLPTRADIDALRKQAVDWDKLAALGTCRLTGKIDMPERKLAGSITTIARGTERFRTDIDLGTLQIHVALDGDRAWNHSSTAALQELDGVALEQARFDHPFRRIADWSGYFTDLRVVAELTRDGKKTWLLRGTPPTSSARSLYVDAETGLLQSEEFVPTLPGMGEIGVSIDYADWREVAGIRLPFRVVVEYASPLIGTATSLYDKFETNVEVPGGSFRLDGAK